VQYYYYYYYYYYYCHTGVETFFVFSPLENDSRSVANVVRTVLRSGPMGSRDSGYRRRPAVKQYARVSVRRRRCGARACDPRLGRNRAVADTREEGPGAAADPKLGRHGRPAARTHAHAHAPRTDVPRRDQSSRMRARRPAAAVCVCSFVRSFLRAVRVCA